MPRKILILVKAFEFRKVLQSYQLDRVHSGASFVVRHAVTPMTGYFTDFDVDIEWNSEDPTQSVITAELDPASVVMGNESLAETLRGVDFFDTKNNGKWTFFSKKIEEDVCRQRRHDRTW